MTREPIGRSTVSLHNSYELYYGPRKDQAMTLDPVRLAKDTEKMKRWAEEVKRQERIDRIIKGLGRTTKAERRFIEETFKGPKP